MFDRYADDRGTEPWRWRWRRMGPAVALAIAAHLGGLAALLVDQWWQVDKLHISDPQVVLSFGTGAPLPTPAAAPAPAAKPEGSSRRPRVTRDLAQPELTLAAAAGQGPDPVEGAPRGEPGAHGLKLFGHCSSGGECVPTGLAQLLESAVCGNGRVEPGEECDDGGRADGDGCSPLCARERRVKLDNRIVEGYRIAGDPQIHAPESVREAMADRNKTATFGAVEMCLRTDGTVATLRLRRSTGYGEYDAALLSGMKRWRYRPYRLTDGTAVPACTLVVVIYRMTIRDVAASRSGLH